MKRTPSRLIAALALAAASLVGLSACTTAPAAPPSPAIAAPSTVELMLKVRAAELELERIDKMAMLKFAAESGSDLVKGAVMGMSMGKGSGNTSPGASSTSQTLMQAQAQADSVALRREELAYANSWDKRALPYVSLGLDFWRFDKTLSFQRFQTTEANAQNRYTLDTLSNSQTAGYTFGAGAYSAGSAATLGGLTAGQE